MIDRDAFDFSCGLLGMLESYGGKAPLIHATLDDVGTCGNDGMCAVVGYVAYRPQWESFNFAWRQTLRELGLSYLHASEYIYRYLRVGDHPPTDGEIYKCLTPFINIVNLNLTQPRRGFGMVVVTRCSAYEQLTTDEKKYVRPPELNSFELAIGLACLRVKDELSEENTIAVQMDESQNATTLYVRYQALKQENDTLKNYLGAICFADDKIHWPVQAADMLGHLALRAWRNHEQQKAWPIAFRNLIRPTGDVNTVSLICGIDFLRGLAKMRKDRNDRMAMPSESGMVGE